MHAMPPKSEAISRSGFLSLLIKGSLAGSALIGLGVLVRYFSFQNEAGRPKQYDLGPASDYPPGSRIAFSPAQAIIIHNDQGFNALNLVCPHLGCEVNITSDGFACPCHGSRYLKDGSLRNGPASRPLTILRVEVNSDDHLILYTG